MSIFLSIPDEGEYEIRRLKQERFGSAAELSECSVEIGISENGGECQEKHLMTGRVVN